jgi:signal transduction histidine kinase
MGDSAAFIRHSGEAMTAAKPTNIEQTRMECAYGYANYYSGQNQLHKAIEYFRDCLLISQRLQDTRMATESKLGIAKCFEISQQHDSALAVLKGLNNRLKEGQYLPLKLRYFDIVSNAYEKKGLIKLALMYRNRHRTLSDSVVGLAMMNNAMMARLKFDEEQTEIILNKQSEVIQLNARVIDRQQLLLIVSVILGVVLLGFAIALYRFSQYQKRISAELDRKVFERTRELQASGQELVKRLNEQRDLLDLISSRLRSTLATIRGLWSIVLTDSHDKGALDKCFNKAITDLLQVPEVVERTAQMKTKAEALTRQGQPDNQLLLSLSGDRVKLKRIP